MALREVVNISLPKAMAERVERAVRHGGYASKSEFFRMLLRKWEEEEAAMKNIRTSEEEFAAGTGKMLRTLKDLR